MGLNLQIIEEDLEDPRPDSAARIGPIARMLRGQIEQLETTLSDFLSFALPGGRRSREFDLCALLKEAHDLLAPEIDRRGVEWREESPPSLRLHGEPAAIHEVIVNLVLNALHAMERIRGERTLSVSLKEEADQAALTIEDTGPGIEPADLKRIFEVFYSTKEGGAGFGLAIARRVIEDHGGTIEVANRPEGGAMFIMRLPLANPEDKSE
jgi:signal transduction histidine kinase